MESAAVGAFLKPVMGKLLLLLEKEYSKHSGLARETESIQDDLRMIAAAMDYRICTAGRHERTAIERQYNAVILDLVHDIEDCVDRFTHRLKCKQRGGSGTVSSLVSKLKKIQIRSSYADEIQELKKRLEDVRQRVMKADPFGQQPDGLRSMLADSSSRLPRSTVGIEPPPPRLMVGIEKPMEELLSLLREVDGEPQQLRVISIVGFGGLGKTTLARAVYDSPHAKEAFHCRAWVSATDTSPEITNQRIKAILRGILRQVVPKDSLDLNVDNNNPEASFKEYLSDKRYLIVIDDIQMDEWKAVNSAFVDGSTGSRIILTTTIQSVANVCSHGNGYVYQMNTLGEEDSKKIALLGLSSPELDHGSARLLGKCDGLPLALVSVSDYLKSSYEQTGVQCAMLCRDLGFHLSPQEKHDRDSFSDLRKVLVDNYDSLSGYALSCLLYLGIFPNNRPLKRKVVTRRWVAEGYARSESLRDEQNIADDNFKNLLDRNIIQPIDTRNNAQVKSCKTHGTMHEFVLYESMWHRFIMTLSPDHPRAANNARHLSVYAGKLTDCVTPDEDLSRVRSLTVFGKGGEAISYVRKCKLIRVLDLEHCTDALKDEEFEHICKLWHLKYLSLGNTVCELQRCIDGLHCLETLDLRRTKIQSLPTETIQLPHLTHLFGNKLMLDKDDLKNAKKMSKLEKFLSGNKSNLQTLSGFVADDSKGFISSKKEDSKGFLQFIMDMSKLRKVKIWCKRVANNDGYLSELSKAIQKLTKVPIDRYNDCSLALDFDEETCEDLLSSLDLETCSEDSKYDLRSLKLHGKLPLLPPFVTLLSGLTDLCISSATLARGLLSVLGNLDKLLYLKLVADLLEGFEIKQGAFPSLQRLCVQVQHLNVARATIEKGALPYLVSLQLLCTELVVALSGINIKHFNDLKEVTIDIDEATAHAKCWEHSVKNHPNKPRLMFAKTINPIRSEEVGPCDIREKRKRCPTQPNLDDELDSSLKKMRLSESYSWNKMIVHPVMGADTMASSSNPIPLHADESGSWMQQPSHS